MRTAARRWRLWGLFNRCYSHCAERNEKPPAYFLLVPVIDGGGLKAGEFVQLPGRRISRGPRGSRPYVEFTRGDRRLAFVHVHIASTSRALHSSWTEASRGDRISPKPVIIQWRDKCNNIFEGGSEVLLMATARGLRVGPLTLILLGKGFGDLMRAVDEQPRHRAERPCLQRDGADWPAGRRQNDRQDFEGWIVEVESHHRTLNDADK